MHGHKHGNETWTQLIANVINPLYGHLTTMAAVYEQNDLRATFSVLFSIMLQRHVNYALRWHKAKRVSCYDVMMYVKEVTVLWHSWHHGNVNAGQWGSGEGVHSWFDTVHNNWPGVSAP